MVNIAIDSALDVRADRRPSTVLFLAANPQAMPLLQLGEECRAIEDRIREARFRDQLRFRSRWAARPDDLLQALHEDEPAVLHFSGHGAGGLGLCFLAEDGGVFCVPSDALAQVVRAAGDRIQLVVLNACYSQVQAQALVTHVPCVIGMPEAIDDKSAVVYAADLYRALAFGKSVAIAHQCALAALALHSHAGCSRDIDVAAIALQRPTPELLIRPGVDAARVYLVRGAELSIAADTQQRSRIHVEIDLDTELETVDAELLARIVGEVARLSGGQAVKIICVKRGSVKLVLSMTPAAAEAFAIAHGSGRVEQICGLRVSDVGELGRIESAMPGREDQVGASAGALEFVDASLSARLATLRPEERRRVLDDALDAGLAFLDGIDVSSVHVLHAVIATLSSFAGGDEIGTGELADGLHRCGVALRVRRREARALTALQAAVELRRELATVDPDALRPQLAESLHELGIALRSRGQLDAALAATSEATELLRGLTAIHPGGFQRELARSLHNLGIMHHELGHVDAAMGATREAVDWHRAAAAHGTADAVADLVGSLNNLSNRLREAGALLPALWAAREAVALSKALARGDRGRFQAAFAMSLHNIGGVLRERRRFRAARVTVRAAAVAYRVLVSGNRDRFAKDLAGTLSELAFLHDQLGERSEAFTVTEEAVELHRALAAQDPERSMPDLARSLSQLARRLRELGRRRVALGAAFEALRLYRWLAGKRPEQFEPELADHLNDLGVDWAELGERAAALEATNEAAQIYAKLASRDPDHFQLDLARTARNASVLRAPATWPQPPLPRRVAARPQHSPPATGAPRPEAPSRSKRDPWT